MWLSYLINLKANTGRLENCAAQFEAAGLPWRRVEGVNGWALSDAEVAAVYDEDANRRRAKHPLVKPEIGCYLSHVEAWRQIADGAEDGGFIFEDDFRADGTLGTVLRLLSSQAPDWDMVKLFSFDSTPKMVSERDLGEGIKIGVPYRVPTCLIGYGLTKAAAQRLVAGAVPFFRPVDEDMKFYWERNLKVALVLPPPIVVGDQAAETGTIGDARRADAAGRKDAGRQRPLHKLLYQIDYTTRLHYHRLLKD